MMKSRIPEDHWLVSLPIAHRGLHNEEYPENSLAAFENAARRGYPIELDVHISSDGQLFVFHDDNAKRMTGLDADVNEMNLEDIQKLRLLLPREREAAGAVSDEKPQAEESIIDLDEDFARSIPTLDEVLKLVRGRVPILIETKTAMRPGLLERKLYERLEEYRKECGDPADRWFVVQSFDPRSIRLIKKMDPSYITGQLSQNMSKKDLKPWEKWVLSGCRLNFYSKPDFISYKAADLPAGRIMAKHGRGMPLVGWTVRSYEEENKAVKFCDNIIFERIRPEIDA